MEQPLTDTPPFEETLVCDPSNEWCDEFDNTIELDYSGPNFNIGMVNFAMWLVPVIAYNFAIVMKPGDIATVDALAANNYYTYGWRWLDEGSKVIFGVPSILWAVNQFFYSDVLTLVLLGWWSTAGSFLAPLYFGIGFYFLSYPLWNWDSAFEPAVSYTETLLYSLFWGVLWSSAWTYFYRNWYLAILHWD